MFSNRRITVVGFLATRNPNSGRNRSKAGKVSFLQSHLAKQEAHQRITEAPKTGQPHVPLLHHLQRTLRIEENVCPFPGSEGHEPECPV